jgi:hypothetical protein
MMNQFILEGKVRCHNAGVEKIIKAGGLRVRCTSAML